MEKVDDTNRTFAVEVLLKIIRISMQLLCWQRFGNIGIGTVPSRKTT